MRDNSNFEDSSKDTPSWGDLFEMTDNFEQENPCAIRFLHCLQKVSRSSFHRSFL